MKIFIRSAAILAIAVLMLTGCSVERSNGLLGDNVGGLMNAAFIIPAGADIVSATFFVYSTQASGQPVNLYRVTSDWDEATVTWNSFGGAYDPTIHGWFLSDDFGWKSADLTDLFKAWVAGDYDNFGLLMDQPDVLYAMSTYHSRENIANMIPYLEICYELEGSFTCVTVDTDADAFIREYYPDINWGHSDYLAVGWGAQEYLEKQSLVRFDFDIEPPDDTSYGCALTIGFWKRHAGIHRGNQVDVVSQYLPIWLGDAGGACSQEVTTNYEAVDVLKQEHAKNGIVKLKAQMLGTKLNLAAGADDSDVAAAIIESDAFLATHCESDWDSLDKDTQQYVLDLKDMFDDYNNGIIGPGHCGD